MPLINIAIYFIVFYESVVGTGSLYMLWIYVVKPRMQFKRIQANIPKEGMAFIADIHIFNDGIYAGTWNNANLNRMFDDFIAKITGSLPKTDTKSLIENVVKKNIAENTERIITQALDKEKITALLAAKIDAELEKQLDKV